jgi:hypothetical protein
MSRAPDYLFDLLPQVYRMRDAQQGNQLRALLRIVNGQVNVIEQDIARLYENWFIETCGDWAVPYIGDLVGYQPVDGAGPGGPAPRREVAATITLRRRKGALALLETLARDVANWPARAVEFYALLGWTQHLDHQRLARARLANLREGDALAQVGGPFDELARSVDLRRIGAPADRGHGRHNIPSVGLFVWRLKSYPVTRTPACCAESLGPQFFSFSVLGNDTALYTRAEREASPTSISQEINLPAPVRRRAFEQRSGAPGLPAQASPLYYGEGKSLSIGVQDWPARGRRGEIAADRIIAADLSDWHAYRAPPHKVLVDPQLGRMVFPPGHQPRKVWVSYHYGFSADMGGGEYRRALSQPDGARVYRVRRSQPAKDEFKSVELACLQWNQDKQLVDPQTGRKPRAAVIEIQDNGVYQLRLAVRLDPCESLQLRAAAFTRPVLRLLDFRADQPDPFTICGGEGSRFTLDGLMVAGRGIEINGIDAGSIDDDSDAEPGPPLTGQMCDVTIRHCTLVPGWDLDCACSPRRPAEPSVTLRYTAARLTVEHSILGPVWLSADETRADPVSISISDSIVDASGMALPALCDERGGHAFATLRLERTTVIGALKTHAVSLVEDSIVTGALRVVRRQAGCLRFSYLAPGSRTPRRFHCQPDPAAVQTAPLFTSLRYGAAAYCQLALDCPAEIARGASDESEMGAFHDLFQPQRDASLRTRLDEYTPAGMDAGIIYAS